MDKVKVLYDIGGRTLSVWVKDPQGEVVCEQVGDMILMKDARGGIIGFEKLNVSLPADGSGITVELTGALTDPG